MSHIGTRLRRTGQTAAALGVVAALLTGCSSGAAEPETEDAGSVQPSGSQVFVDELGREVEIDLPVTAVYTDYLYQAEAVRLVGGGDLIVAQGDATDPANPLNTNNQVYFESFADAVDVGAFDQPNWEAVVDSGAQVAFVMRNGAYQDAIEKLEPFGIDVFVVTSWDPKVLREYIPVLGEILGTQDQAAKAEKLFTDIETILDERIGDLSDEERKTVYHEGSTENTTAVPGSGFHDVIVDAGGLNLFGDVNVSDDSSAKVHEFPVDPVEVVSRNPDVVIQNTVGGLTGAYEPAPREEYAAKATALSTRAGWDQVTAVQNDDVYVTNNFLYSSLGKKIGSLWLATTLYPERFEDVDVDDYFSQWTELQGVAAKPAADYVTRLQQ